MDSLLTVRNWLSQLTEGLANLTVKNVLMAVGILLLILVIRRCTEPRSRRHDWVIENVQVVLSVVVVVFLIIRPFLFQAFYIPSGSMEPTLMGPRPGEATGDRLLVNKLVYRVGNPNRFDIAVFKAPPNASPDEKEFIKRVIGLPNETIEVVPPRILVDRAQVIRMTSESDAEGVLQVNRSSVTPQVKQNRVQIDATFMPSYTNAEITLMAAPHPEIDFDGFRVVVDGKVELEDSSGRIRQENTLQNYGWDPKLQGSVFSIDGDPRLAVIQGSRMTYDPGHVVIQNGKGRQRLIEPYIQESPRYAYLPKKLGPHQYFMMGDNRNNSNDSHSWGPLERDRVIGRAEILFWPPNRINILHWWLISAMVCLFAAYYQVQRWLLDGRAGHST